VEDAGLVKWLRVESGIDVGHLTGEVWAYVDVEHIDNASDC